MTGWPDDRIIDRGRPNPAQWKISDVRHFFIDFSQNQDCWMLVSSGGTKLHYFMRGIDLEWSWNGLMIIRIDRKIIEKSQIFGHFLTPKIDVLSCFSSRFSQPLELWLCMREFISIKNRGKILIADAICWNVINFELSLIHITFRSFFRISMTSSRLTTNYSIEHSCKQLKCSTSQVVKN